MTHLAFREMMQLDMLAKEVLLCVCYHVLECINTRCREIIIDIEKKFRLIQNAGQVWQIFCPILKTLNIFLKFQTKFDEWRNQI